MRTKVIITTMKMEDKTVDMNLWFKGEENREIFSVLSPKSTAFTHGGPLPEKYNELPIPALVVRQKGEAWNKPFVAIYEPGLNGNSNIQSVDYFGKNEFVGIHVKKKSGKEDFIFLGTSSDEKLTNGILSVTGSYGINSKKGHDFTMFLGKGKTISNTAYTIQIVGEQSSASLKKENGEWYFTSGADTDLKIKVNHKIKNSVLTDALGKEYIGKYNRKSKTVIFNLPKFTFQTIKINYFQ